jgi:hypothetical protein
MYASNHVGKLVHQIQDPWKESPVLHKKHNGYPAITCTIYYQKIKNALCDLGANVNLMPKAMFKELGYPAISSPMMTIQLANSSIKNPKGIIENLLVNVRGSYDFVDFVVLDTQEEMSIILGRPFLRDVNARIYVGAGRIQFRTGQRNMTFTFQAKEEQCYLVQDEKSRRWRKPHPQYKEDKVAPTKPKVETSKGSHQPKNPNAINKAKGEEKTENINTPRQSLINFSATEENKEGVACEGSIV